MFFLPKRCNFVKQNRLFVQILNVEDSHWVCVAATIDCKFNSVKIFDSRKTGDLSLQTKEVIATLLHCDKKTISVIYPTVQQQSDGASCGLFALAFAYSVCEGENPSEILYNCEEFRDHFLSCLQRRKIWSFPCKAGKAVRESDMSSSVKFRVYCLCHLPDTGDKMICCSNCTEWYHFTCVQISQEMALPDDWSQYCPKCC